MITLHDRSQHCSKVGKVQNCVFIFWIFRLSQFSPRLHEPQYLLEHLNHNLRYDEPILLFLVFLPTKIYIKKDLLRINVHCQNHICWSLSWNRNNSKSNLVKTVRNMGNKFFGFFSIFSIHICFKTISCVVIM